MDGWLKNCEHSVIKDRIKLNRNLDFDSELSHFIRIFNPVNLTTPSTQ
jgi:hypothetical protein